MAAYKGAQTMALSLLQVGLELVFFGPLKAL
jgi:hypothetical protein